MQAEGVDIDVFSQYFSRDLEKAYWHIDRLALHLCFHVVHQFHLFDDRTALTFDDILRKAAAVRDAEYLIHTILDILQEYGYLLREGEAWRILKPVPEDESEALQIRAREECPGEVAVFDLLERCYTNVGPFITGEKSGVDVFFPKGDLTLWEVVHRESRVISVYNDLIRTSLEPLLARPAARILEVGGGIGGVLKHNLDLLRERDIEEYRFTDLGKYFVNRMRKAYGTEPFLRFSALDLDQPFATQGIEPNSFDIVIGVSVVHATKSLEFTLRELRWASREGGHLLMGEASVPARGQHWGLDIVFGFLQGWWDVTLDPVLRPRPGLLLPSEWLELFRFCGYQSATAFPGQAWFRGPCRGGLLMAVR